MKRIFIDKRVIHLSKEYASNLFLNRNPKGKKGSKFIIPLAKLKGLEKKLRKDPNITQYADYVKIIIDKYSVLNALKPIYFDCFDKKYLKRISNIELDNKVIDEKKFYELIVEAMCYKEARTEYLPYARKLGIKACVYCNTQLAATVDLDEKSLKGMYELDHFYPKSKYPYLSTSFFNLQPVCSYCNKSKNYNKAMFNLYTTEYDKIAPFNFVLEKKSLVRYMLTQNCEDLKIIFDSTEIDSNGNRLIEDHNKHFHIDKLYDTQKDFAEEIVWKSKIYNKSYQKSLQDSFSKMFSKTDFNRFILGNYDQLEDIHKRPMTKFVQDIARQLKLID